VAQIGNVFKTSYTKNGQVFPLVEMDIRTITMRKKFTLAVNKLKYPDGVVGGAVTAGKEDHTDYHIWANFSNRGESIPSVIVGNMKNAVSEKGVKYKRGKIFDPFVSNQNIYITLFEVDKEKRIDESHIYSVVAEPYTPRPMNQNGYSASAQPEYNDQWAGASGSMTTADGREIPVHVGTDASEAFDPTEEIPF